MDSLQLIKIRKQRLIRLTIIISLSLVVVLTYLETQVFRLGTLDFPVSGNVIVFSLINVNVLLLLMVVFLVLRNLAELVFERKKKMLGSRLRTKLVVSFISLSLIPTALLFFVALQFVSTSMDYWFNINVEESLVTAQNLAKAIYQQQKEDLRTQAGRMTLSLQSAIGRDRAANLELIATRLLQGSGLDAVAFVSENNDLLAAVGREGRPLSMLIHPSQEAVRKSLQEGTTVVTLESKEGEFIQGLSRIEG